MEPEVPEDFPRDYLGAVSGAQPKLLVIKDAAGRYVSAAPDREKRWRHCQDLCEQLVDYVNKKLPAGESLPSYATKVGAAVGSKLEKLKIWPEEATWIRGELVKRFADK